MNFLDIADLYLQQNAYESYFNDDEFYPDMPSLKQAKNSALFDVNLQDPERYPEEPISTDNQSLRPEDSCDASNTEAITFTESPQFSGFCESDTNAPKESEISPRETEKSENVEDLVSQILGSPFVENGDLMNRIEQKLTSQNARLVKIIDKLLKGDDVTQEEVESMSYLEQCVFIAIFNKKRSAVDAPNPRKRQKREEEKQKLFFKACLKHTDKEFFQDLLDSKKKIKRKQIDRLGYYDHYWGQTAKEKNIDLACFFHPNKKIAKGNTTAQTKYTQNPWVKSLNTSFIELILTSAKFREVTSLYLENTFSQDYIKSRSKKIGKMLDKFQVLAMETLNECGNVSEQAKLKAISEAIQDYLNNNPKCKLPWSNVELKETKDYARSMVLKQQVASESDTLFNGCNFPRF